MPLTQTWSAFQDQQTNSLPLTFEHGMRNSVECGSYCPMHSHASIEVVYHPTGRGVTHTDFQEKLFFQEGSAVIYPPNFPHDQTVDTKGEDFCVQLTGPHNRDSVPSDWLLVPYIDNRHIREEMEFLSRGMPRLIPVEQTIYNLRATAVLLELIQIATSQQAHNSAELGEQYVSMAERYIRENFSTLGSLPAIAASLGVSYDYLRHEFSARRGVTLIRHLTEVRIERAKTLLKHSNLPLKQVATMCGFKDKYYFSAVFRQYMNTAPGSYRHAAR